MIGDAVNFIESCCSTVLTPKQEMGNEQRQFAVYTIHFHGYHESLELLFHRPR